MGHASYRYLVVVLLALVSVLAASLLARASPRQWQSEGWSRTDFSRRSIEWADITSGGLPKDGIPAIDAPLFRPAGEEKQIADQEPVIGLVINGDARAYPLRVLVWHEIANDIVGETPVAVTYCPLCNAAIVFDRRASGQTLTFGTTGKLRRSDLVMYDRQTESWWQQFSGEAIVGVLTGAKLRMIPSRLESFALFKERNPTGRVLVPDIADQRAYGRNPYEGYDSSNVPFLYRGEYPEGINPMARVVAVRGETGARAVSLELLRTQGPLALAGYFLSWTAGQSSALHKSTISAGRDIGNVLVQRRRDGLLEDVPYDVTFAFVFHAFHPDVEIKKSCPAVKDESQSPELSSNAAAEQLRCRAVIAQ